MPDATHDEIVAAERREIAERNLVANGLNISEGGDGVSGPKSPEWKGRDPDYRKRLSETNRHSPLVQANVKRILGDPEFQSLRLEVLERNRNSPDIQLKRAQNTSKGLRAMWDGIRKEAASEAGQKEFRF